MKKLFIYQSEKYLGLQKYFQGRVINYSNSHKNKIKNKILKRRKHELKNSKRKKNERG